MNHNWNNGIREVTFEIYLFQLEPASTADEILNGLKYVRPGNGFEPKFQMCAKCDVNGDYEEPLYTFLKVSTWSPSQVTSLIKTTV